MRLSSGGAAVLSFILRRLLTAIPTLFLIITISFFLMRLAPGGPFDLERPLEAKVMENLNRIYKLDRPLFGSTCSISAPSCAAISGRRFILRDFTVAELFARGLPVSMKLGASALILAVVVGGTLGIIAAFRQNSVVDYAVTGLGAFGITIPTFVVAPVLQIVFGLASPGSRSAGWNDGALRNRSCRSSPWLCRRSPSSRA